MKHLLEVLAIVAVCQGAALLLWLAKNSQK